MKGTDVLKKLDNGTIEDKLSIARDLSLISKDDLNSVFNAIINMYEREVRIYASEQINLCPNIYSQFLADPDPQVRANIIKEAPWIRKALNSTDIVDQVCKLSKDSSFIVRSAVAKILFKLSEKDEKADFEQKIVPVLKTLLSDESDEVRIQASLNLFPLTTEYGFDFLFEHFSSSIQSMIDDSQWRLRLCAIGIFSSLGTVSDATFVNANLLPFFKRSIHDYSACVREAVAKGLIAIANHLGYQWVKNSLILTIQNLSNSPNYLDRQFYLRVMPDLIAFYPKQYQSNMYQQLIRMLHDPVYCVVYAALDILSQHLNHIHPFRLQHELKPTLQTLLNSNSPTSINEKAEKIVALLNH